jgi:hypothetical protein
LAQSMGQTKERQSTGRDPMNTPPNASRVERLITWVGVVTAGMTLFLLAILLVHKPFGIQIVSLVAYTEFVFFLVFCDSRAWHGYSLRNKRVQQEMPCLLGVHFLFLVLVFGVLTFALSAQSRLPGSWLVESGSRNVSRFAFALLLIGTITAWTQAWICRKILRRAMEVENTTMR